MNLFNLLIEVYNIEDVRDSLYEFVIQQPFTFPPEGCNRYLDLEWK